MYMLGCKVALEQDLSIGSVPFLEVRLIRMYEYL
jgi:hypothetical protein